MAKKKKEEKPVATTPAQDILYQNALGISDQLREGVSIRDICRKLAVDRGAFYRLMEKSEQFAKMVNEANRVYEMDATADIKKAIVQAAQDREVSTEKVLPNGKVVRHKKHVAADMNAAKMWLYNKAGDEFKDKQEIAVTHREIKVEIIDADYEVLPDEQEPKLLPEDTNVVIVEDDEAEDEQEPQEAEDEAGNLIYEVQQEQKRNRKKKLKKLME